MVLWPLFLEILTIPPRVSGVASGETPETPQISDSPNPLFWPAEVKKRWGEVFDARLASKWLKNGFFPFFSVDFVKFDEKIGLWSKNCLFLPFFPKSRKSSRKWPSEKGWKNYKTPNIGLKWDFDDFLAEKVKNGCCAGSWKSRFGDCIALSHTNTNQVHMYHRTPADPHSP